MQNRHLAILKEEHIPRIFQDSGYVGSDDARVLAVSQYHRAVLTGAIDRLRIVRKENCERKRAFQHGDRLLERRERISAIVVSQQLGNDFRIRLGDEDAAVLDQHALDLLIIFNDSVMYDRQRLAGVRMRVRIDVRRLAVRRPAGVSNAALAADRRFVE